MGRLRKWSGSLHESRAVFGGRLYILLLKGVISLAGFYVQLIVGETTGGCRFFGGEIILVHWRIFPGHRGFLCKSETDEGCAGATLIQSARGSHNYLNRSCSFAEEVLHLWQLRRTAVWGKRCWIFS